MKGMHEIFARLLKCFHSTIYVKIQVPCIPGFTVMLSEYEKNMFGLLSTIPDA